MRQEPMKSVPVDPNNPEKPIKLIVQATQYLVDEVSRMHALASDGSDCKTAFAGSVLLAELNRRIETYQQRGLQALVQIVNDLVREYDKPAVQPPATGKEPADDNQPPAAPAQ